MNPVVKVVGTHAVLVGGAAAAAVIARDLFILYLTPPKP
jgi:hypothetical protein